MADKIKKKIAGLIDEEVREVIFNAYEKSKNLVF